jgi:uncharacterized cupredoxin-like copper-binding protein
MNPTRWPGRRAVALACAAALGLALAGCAKGHTTTPTAAASSGGISMAVYDVSVQKFRYQGAPDTIKAGRVFLTLTNKETYPMTHELVVVAVPSGKTFKDIVAAARKTGDKSEDQWLHFGEVAEVNTGATIAGVFSLPPGTYAMACWQTGTPQGKPEGGPVHATLGMIHQFTVT